MRNTPWSALVRKRIFGAFLSGFFFVSQVVFANAAESNLWHERFNAHPNAPAGDFAGRLSELLAPYGSVRQSSAPTHSSSGRVVVQIQDVHQNAEAQANIAKAVQQLIDENSIDLV